jgi:Domain of unknown function (DUF4328)
VLDIWVCSSCHSINRERATKCYKCGAPRAVATGEGEGLRTGRAIAARLGGSYRSTFELAAFAAVFLLVFAGMQVWSTIQAAGWTAQAKGLLDTIAAGGPFDVAAWDAIVKADDTRALASFAAYMIAMVAFGGWLAVSVWNIPALGGGTPRVSVTRAFLSSVIPLYNLRKVPGIVQEVLWRTDPRRGSVFLVGLAWVGLFGSWLAARVVGYYINLRIGSEAENATSVADLAQRLKPLMDLGFILQVVVSGLVGMGAVILVVIIVEAERRAAARNREIEAKLGSVA